MKITKFRSLIVALALFVSAVSPILYDGKDMKAEASVPFVNELITIDSSGVQSNGYTPSDSPVSISKDGRYVSFTSTATNLVANDTNAKLDIFVRDRVSGSTVRASTDTSGAQANNSSSESRISANGRYVVFVSSATNLVAGDTNAKNDLFVKDLQSGNTSLVSVSTAGALGNYHSGVYEFDISADGRFIVFDSTATNLVSGDNNGAADIFVRDTILNTTIRLSVSDTGTEGNSFSYKPSISCDGSIVAYISYASNLISGDTNGNYDLIVVDRVGGHRIINASIASVTGGSYGKPDVSCDGSTVSFLSTATDLVAGDTNAKTDIFTYSINASSFEGVSVDSSGSQGNGHADGGVLSNDGRYVAFISNASNMVTGDTNAKADAFIRDRQSGTTERVSMRTSSIEITRNVLDLEISADGKYVVFNTVDNLVTSDLNISEDVFTSQTGYTACSI